MNTQLHALEYVLTDSEFVQLRQIVYRQTGISLGDSKRELLYNRLARRLRKLQLRSFGEYCALVEQGNAEELQELTNAMTTNLTSFFREKYHFEQLAAEALPATARRRADTHRVRLWSAGCSTGEEPYSMAIVLREAQQSFSGWDVRLLATDIDSKVVQTAVTGEYPSEGTKGVEAQRLSRWFERDERAKLHRVSDELKSLITFKQLNLLNAWPFSGPFDVIFCRNVTIYFDSATRQELFERMAAVQEPGAWLFIGHSENLINVTRQYKLVGRTVYRRVE